MEKVIKTVGIAVVVTWMGFIRPMSSSADVYFFENFDGYTDGNSLIGQAGPNGQTWQTFDLWNGAFHELSANFEAGQNGTLGGGRTPGSGAENAAMIDLGTKVTSGMISVEYDAHIGSSRNSGPQWWLRDTDSGNNVSIALDWMDNASGGLDPQSGFHDATPQPPNLMWNTDITPLTTDIHGSYLIDVDNKTVTYTYTSLQEPDKIATGGPYSYDKDYQPNNVALYMGALASQRANGYDNICIATSPAECGAATPMIPTDFTWNSANSGDWNVLNHWGGGPPGDQSAVRSSLHTATFADAIGSESRTVYLDSVVSVNSITFDNDEGSYRIAGGPSIDLISSTVGVDPSLTVGSGSHEFQVAVGVHGTLTVDVASGASLEFINRFHLNGNTVTKTGAGTIFVNNSFNTGGGTIVAAEGTVSGGGTIGGNLDNSGGTVAPGNSPGVLTVDGNFNNGAAGTVAMEIEGTAGAGDGNGHDQIQVTGSSTLDGTLSISSGAYADPTARAARDDFTLIASAGGSTGTFATVNYNETALEADFTGENGSFRDHINNGLFRSVNYDGNNVSVTNLFALEGDADGDIDIDITDFNILASNFDDSGANSATNSWTTADFDSDGDIDITDFNFLAANFADTGYDTSASLGQVPEPTSIALIVLGFMAIAFCSFRKR